MPDIQLVFPPEEENIELQFPIDNANIDLAYVVTFDNISGYLPVARLERSGLLTAEEAHNIWNEA